MIGFGVFCVFLLITIHLDSISNSEIMQTRQCSSIPGNAYVRLGNKFFFMNSENKLTMNQASNYCKRKGGHLADIRNSREFDALAIYFKQNMLTEMFWIGIHRPIRGGAYFSEFSGDVAPFIKWTPDIPQCDICDRRNCVGLTLQNGALTMITHDCFKERGNFICQFINGDDSFCPVPPKIKETYINIGNKYYYIEKNSEFTWYEAHSLCRRGNGNLADIQSKEEMNFLSEHLLQNGLTFGTFWLGGNDLASEGVFKSVVTGKRLTYFRWSPNEPNNGEEEYENCLNLWFIDGMFYMNDWNCYGKAYFICQAS